MIKSVALAMHMGQKRNAYQFWRGYLQGRDHLQDIGIESRILLKLILNKWDGRMWNELMRLKIEICFGLLQ
jgi:hypothetical protein